LIITAQLTASVFAWVDLLGANISNIKERSESLGIIDQSLLSDSLIGGTYSAFQSDVELFLLRITKISP
jgi:hypothetical protein